MLKASSYGDSYNISIFSIFLQVAPIIRCEYTWSLIIIVRQQPKQFQYIFQLIDAGQNKKAISEAEKVLKKHPNLHTAKVNYIFCNHFILPFLWFIHCIIF